MDAAETDIRRLRDELALMRDLISDAWYRVDADWRVLDVNPAFERLAKLPRTALIGRAIWEFAPRNAHDRVAAFVKDMQRDSAPRRMSAYSPAFRRWIDLTIARSGDGFEFFLHDVEEAKRGEAFLRSVLDANADCLKLVEPDGRLSFLNANSRHILEIEDGHDLVGQQWAALWPEPGRTQVEQALAAALSGRSSRFEGFCPTMRGAPRWWDVVVAPVLGADGSVACAVAISRDVTDARKATLALQQLNEELDARVQAEVAAADAARSQLAQAQKMEALGQLAGGVAHDFNNVLQAVQGAAGMIERRPENADRVQHLARLVLEAAKRGASVTRRLLAFSHRGELQATAVDVERVLHDLREMLAHTLGALVQVQVDIAPGVPPLLADKGQLETVLVNLATNARDAMPDGGTLRFSATLATAADGPALAEGRYVRIDISDTGMGMDAATLTRASEPFFTTKAVGKGTGLGLAMARGFAEQSGGALRLHSATGEGTQVELWLPIAEHAGDAQPGSARDGLGSAVSRGRVLLVDDDALAREALTAQLEAASFEVMAAEGGAEAMSLLARHGIDLLVTDLAMPGMAGPALIAAAQRLRPGLPAILLTGYAGDAVSHDSARAGTYSLLRKPVDGVVLAERADLMMQAAGLR